MEDIANGKGIEEGVSRVGSSNTKGDAKDNACKKCGFESPMSGKCPASGKDCYRLVQQNSLNIVQIEIKLQKLVQACYPRPRPRNHTARPRPGRATGGSSRLPTDSYLSF